MDVANLHNSHTIPDHYAPSASHVPPDTVLLTPHVYYEAAYNPLSEHKTQVQFYCLKYVTVRFCTAVFGGWSTWPRHTENLTLSVFGGLAAAKNMMHVLIRMEFRRRIQHPLGWYLLSRRINPPHLCKWQMFGFYKLQSST